MGEERRCENCGKTIDEGKLCSMCQIRPTEKFPVDMGLKYDQGKNAMGEIGEMIKNDNLG